MRRIALVGLDWCDPLLGPANSVTALAEVDGDQIYGVVEGSPLRRAAPPPSLCSHKPLSCFPGDYSVEHNHDRISFTALLLSSKTPGGVAT